MERKYSKIAQSHLSLKDAPETRNISQNEKHDLYINDISQSRNREKELI